MKDKRIEQWNELFAVRRSVRYHDRRTSHFERLHRLTNLISILLAGVVLMAIAGTDAPFWIKVLAVVGVVLSGLDLLIGFSRRADVHRDLKRRYVRLERDMLKAMSIEQVQERRLAIEADEPPVYRALDLLCHNELCVAEGFSRKEHSEHFSDIPWYVSLTANWLHWSNAGENIRSCTPAAPASDSSRTKS